MEEAREVNMLAILTDNKPGILTLRKLDRGHTPPRSEIEARVLEELCRRIDKDTCVAWGSRLTKGSRERGSRYAL